eukprot:scaffold440428_cov45-Prasinocladus_malaysianus.AAC.1
MASCMRATAAGARVAVVPARPAIRSCQPMSRTSTVSRRASVASPKAVMEVLGPIAALDIDWSDPDTQIAAAGALLGVGAGIGIPVFLVSRDQKDEERLEELRALNRQTFKETGEYLTPKELFRPVVSAVALCSCLSDELQVEALCTLQSCLSFPLCMTIALNGTSALGFIIIGVDPPASGIDVALYPLKFT